ncbi:efflux RND transporter periplasmic adaptor subunit [Candidatus Fermentibacterales bacterium]|nr:efflux RND transporter periplasmic adaptor subunit [Candidatus Fermentibacterales bacterium]
MRNRPLETTFAIMASCSMLIASAACGPPPPPPERPVPVRAAEATGQTISREVYANSRLEGIEEALIYASMPGRILEVLVSEGDSVEAGQKLVRLDTDQQTTAGTSAALAAISAARANADNAGQNLERMETLFQAGAVSEQQLDAARTGAEAAQAQLNQAYAGYNQAESVRDNAVIEAPFTGRIGRVWARAGNTASGQPLVSISNAEGIVAEALLPESDIYSLRVGLPAYISVTALQGQSFPGIVTAVSPTVDPVSGLVPVEVRFDNPDQLLRPGMTCRVSIMTETSTDAVVVPESVLRRTRDGYEIAIVEDGAAVIRAVETGIRTAGMVEITEGVEFGDSVIVRGQNRVSDGSLVEVVER